VSTSRWAPGQVVVRREVLNDGRAWAEIAVIAVEDTPSLLATYIPQGAPFRFPPGDLVVGQLGVVGTEPDMADSDLSSVALQ
jgi:hypothetical protein